MLSSSKYLIVSAFLIYTCHEITGFGYTYTNEMYCPRSGHTDISKCRYGYEIDNCNMPRCFRGPDEECDKYSFGKRCADKLRCSCNFCQGCIGPVCSVRMPCDSQTKRAPSKIRSIAELIRQQEQQQQLQLEQDEQRQLQDLLQRQSDRHAIPMTLPNEFNNNVKSILFDRVAPFYPFNNTSNEIIFNN